MEIETSLSGDEIKKLVQARLNRYEELSALEQYAMFMGKVQILEFGLKGLLARKYDVPTESMRKWTLGSVTKKLQTFGLRCDFTTYLSSVVKHRNYIAHHFLLNDAITSSLASFSDRKRCGALFRAIYELEQIILLYDWCEENGCW